MFSAASSDRASWVRRLVRRFNRCSPFTLEAHGTEGSLLYGTPDAQLLLCVAPNAARGAGRWEAQTDLPADRPPAFDQWVAHIQQGTRAGENVRIALDLTALMEAANRSAAEARQVRLDELDG